MIDMGINNIVLILIVSDIGSASGVNRVARVLTLAVYFLNCIYKQLVFKFSF